jgi:hypothetical protein
VECPDPWHAEEWVFDSVSMVASGKSVELIDGSVIPLRTAVGWRRKTIEEKEMEEAMKEVDEIAPGWKE